MKMVTAVICATLLAVVMSGPALSSAAMCESLASLSLPQTSVTSAETVAAGAFKQPGPILPGPGGFPSYSSLPAFCRVQGVLTPTPDSHIEFEVWMPSTGWNGKFQGAGNGGFAGSIDYAEMAAALMSGYATSSTDTGHKASVIDARWALGHLEKITDYGYRAIHETAVKSKSVLQAFYGEAPRKSYFSSCSNGGRQALMEAQRYPADYDGIIAGAPAANFTRIIASFAWDLLASEVEAASHIPARKFAAIEAAVVGACDARDGVKDGVVDDPTKCRFDPSALLCQGPESDTCLTEPQVAALRKVYAGPRTSKGDQVYPGFLPGGESGPGGWPIWVAGTARGTSLQYAFSTQGNAYLIFQNPAYDYKTFSLERDVKIADETRGPVLNAVNPDLRAFNARGGKLILYHGWSDAALAPVATVNYYESVISKVGKKDAANFTRLYMVPGMQHCGGGPGPDSFGALPSVNANAGSSLSAALEQWVERGVAPGTIVATKYKPGSNPPNTVVRTRPLCPYPNVASYKGAGSTDEAASFVCKAP